MTKKIRPFLKWAGNKYNCLEQILMSLPAANRLIEPFAGSAAIFINSNYPNYLVAEENKDLIALFSCLQKEGETFIAYCEQFFCPDNNYASQYYALRQIFNQENDPRLRAAIFLYLNRHGYNGLCRYNKQGIYNVPFGRYDKPYFPREEMIFFHHKSQMAHFIHADFRKTFALAKPGDVIYCDPPYAPRHQLTNFSSYIHKKFGQTEQILLAKLAMESATKGITVIISNHDTEFTRHHYQHAEIISFSVKRSINRNGKNRLPVKELLAVFR
ncbi:MULTISPECIES: Dam family site-specific DNA-(adenine-N6)-methyltransferase [Legionella]|uniref:Site-specific DNA-methyltransferase (adenine-specific) n=1 Tax=Legionella septentrionalis TaxID=2498109 RepID=A0A3S0VN09_9GAMM|nr:MULTISPECIES: Dam family site-specific DNA-(adenine-N6)-methyltransferase [Legionella]MCP0913740.1 Dam family site-specific DNA-(adenine-N6)-methyltransferase [Legionella sp. 27cVA30]RUQ85398.1 Dam family site-specific DNA-(adenine-N6)-methyltransferase [Legionella septentrionalis]RUQ99312.1 Dam family site-specific DNA-(adenine-N6)-methyltransferase [Legionella septentrionalis]RUR09635.1 Dam family site-specific DNA-(adenine-N6)-methyltransferase [Legionella septentrionalis]RUR14789.1 Dam 